MNFCILLSLIGLPFLQAVQFDFVARHYLPAGYVDATKQSGVPDLYVHLDVFRFQAHNQTKF